MSGRRRLRIPVAVAPAGLLRIVESLMADHPGYAVVGRVAQPADLPRRAARRVPHLVVDNTAQSP